MKMKIEKKEDIKKYLKENIQIFFDAEFKDNLVIFKDGKCFKLSIM